MVSHQKPSRDEINTKFVDVQNRIIVAYDNTAREQVVKEHLHPLIESIHNSDYFGDINPRDLTQRMRDHVDQLGSMASPIVLPLYHFEQQLRFEIADKPQGPRHWGEGAIGDGSGDGYPGEGPIEETKHS